MAQSRRVILLLYPYASYDRGLLQGMTRYSRIHGPWVFYLAGEEPGLPLPKLESVHDIPVRTIRVDENRKVHLPDLHRWGATGIVGRLQTPELVKIAMGSGVPVIAMDLSEEQLTRGSPLAKLSEVRPNSHQAGRLAAEHLLERGLKNFGYCGYEGRIWSERRKQGFSKRLEESGFHTHTYQPPHRRTTLLWQQERASIAAWLCSLPKPVGIMACNDNRGRQVLEASALKKMTVPDSVAVVGVDDDQLLCELSNPPLSSVVLNAEQAGYQTAELLDRLMSHRNAKPQTIEVEPLWVISRQSTDVVAVEDQKVGIALRFIRQNARNPIGTDDVVAQTGLSRRTLEIRFARSLGRSIHTEIQRVRLAWAKQFLLETDMSMEKISSAVGFASLSYLGKVFHRQVGESLAQYRRHHRPS